MNMTREEAEAALMAAVRLLGDEAIRDGYYQDAYLINVLAAYRQGVIAELKALDMPMGAHPMVRLRARIAELEETP